MLRICPGTVLLKPLNLASHLSQISLLSLSTKWFDFIIIYMPWKAKFQELYFTKNKSNKSVVQLHHTSQKLA